MPERMSVGAVDRAAGISGGTNALGGGSGRNGFGKHKGQPAGFRVVGLADLDIRVFSEDGELLRQLSLDPEPGLPVAAGGSERGTTSRDTGGRCLETSQRCRNRIRTIVGAARTAGFGQRIMSRRSNCPAGVDEEFPPPTGLGSADPPHGHPFAEHQQRRPSPWRLWVARLSEFVRRPQPGCAPEHLLRVLTSPHSRQPGAGVARPGHRPGRQEPTAPLGPRL